jgi:hypothetical protein
MNSSSLSYYDRWFNSFSTPTFMIQNLNYHVHKIIQETQIIQIGLGVVKSGPEEIYIHALSSRVDYLDKPET